MCSGGGLNHMISEKQKPVPGEYQRNGRGGRRRGKGFGVGSWLLETGSPHPHLLPVVVVADGGQSLAYCHSPLKGQITSEHCLAGQVQNPGLPRYLHHLLTAVCMSGQQRKTHTYWDCDCVCVCLGGFRSGWVV